MSVPLLKMDQCDFVEDFDQKLSLESSGDTRREENIEKLDARVIDDYVLNCCHVVQGMAHSELSSTILNLTLPCTSVLYVYKYHEDLLILRNLL